MATKKVYVLVRDSICGGMKFVDDNQIRVYATRAAARAQMIKEFEEEFADWKFTYANDDAYEFEKGRMSRAIWAKGFYNSDHDSWVIHAQEILE